MTRTVTLKQIGWTIRGQAFVTTWYGRQGIADMKPTFVPLGKLTRDKVHCSINDGGFGAQSIDRADVEVYRTYENHYHEFGRVLEVENPDHKLTKRGI